MGEASNLKGDLEFGTSSLQNEMELPVDEVNEERIQTALPLSTCDMSDECDCEIRFHCLAGFRSHQHDQHTHFPRFVS